MVQKNTMLFPNVKGDTMLTDATKDKDISNLMGAMSDQDTKSMPISLPGATGLTEFS